LALEQTSGVGTKITKFVNFHPGFKAENAFDMRVRKTIALQVPKTEKFVIKTRLNIEF
jgi:hypothetical protein